ncbi:hypothetical protein DER45DRAFT_609006 [Fusarium avenaceum]|nr:hypothetical protein DER45DRAFT_609006 [Fusarium avenaceum]
MSKSEPITISAYYINFDGTSYKGASRIWTMGLFEGGKDVTRLELHPVRFERDYQKTFQQLQERGQKLQTLFLKTNTDVEHDGWTLTHTPGGDPLENEGEKLEYIDSDVIIDFQEAYRVYPG